MEPFFTTKAMGKGTGLGLSMVYSTVKAHGGQLALQSEPGQGTQVTMRFPPCAAGAQAPEPRPDQRAAVPGGLNVLMVDDDELVQSSMQTTLESLGHTATMAANGEEALARLEHGLRPDVVILDMNMPGLGGEGTLPRLRGLCPGLPILLATGRVDQAALHLAQAHPRVTLLSKPFSKQELKQQLERL
jgi:CheY-like chemotaxis protein